MLLRGVDVLLVHLVGEHHNAFVVGELEESLNGLLAEDGTSRITWFDDDDEPHINTTTLGLVVALVESCFIKFPSVCLVQILSNGSAPNAALEQSTKDTEESGS